MTGCESVEVWEKHNYEHTNEFYDDESLDLPLYIILILFLSVFCFFF